MCAVKSRPKDIGTAGETAVVRACHRAGFIQADRRVLKGSSDQGDVLVCPGVIFEVKSGKQTTTIGPTKLREWLEETECERRNSGADIAVLVTKKPRVGAANAERWDAWLTLGGLLKLVEATTSAIATTFPVRLELGDVLSLLRASVYAGFVSEEVG